ncbi:MAG: SPW repeat protein [Bacteroidota bacterium]|nr:SPW repeat protein [Bacteroidota bacterium]
MKIITTRLRGYLDYTIGITLIVMPWIFNLSNLKSVSWPMIIAGIVTIIQSLATDYECGIFRQISMKTHMKIDFIMGLCLLIIPLATNLFIYSPFIVFGSVKILLHIFTNPIPSYKGYKGYAYNKFKSTYNKFEKFPTMKY